MEIVEESLKNCSTQLNESLNILPIIDGQNEIVTLGKLTTECKTLKEKWHKLKPVTDDDEISKIFKRIETILEKPKDSLQDHMKTLQVCKHSLNINYNLHT